MAKKKDTGTFKLDPIDEAILQDYQVAINHLQGGMGRYLGHIGVKKHGLTEGEAYNFDPNWLDSTITYTKREQEKKLSK